MLVTFLRVCGLETNQIRKLESRLLAEIVTIDGELLVGQVWLKQALELHNHCHEKRLFLDDIQDITLADRYTLLPRMNKHRVQTISSVYIGVLQGEVFITTDGETFEISACQIERLRRLSYNEQ